MTTEERVELLVKAMEGMTQQEWWRLVEMTEVAFEEARARVVLTDITQMQQPLIKLFQHTDGLRRKVTIEPTESLASQMARWY